MINRQTEFYKLSERKTLNNLQLLRQKPDLTKRGTERPAGPRKSQR
jgi:hypothetical protein